MGWFSENSFNNVVRNTTAKASGRTYTVTDLLAKLDRDHYVEAERKVTSIENEIETGSEYKSKKQAILQATGYPTTALSGFKSFVDRNTEKMTNAIQHIAKIFLYITHSKLTTISADDSTKLKEYIEKSYELMASIKVLLDKMCADATRVAEKITSINKQQTQATSRGSTYKCLTKVEIDRTINELISLYEKAKGRTNTLQGGKRKALRKTHNKKKTYMKLACKCTIRKARK